MDDYELKIEDVEITKSEMIKIINKKLERKWTTNERIKGMQIDLFPEWQVAVRKFSIVYQYKKLGWDVFHFQVGDKETDSSYREYLWFKNPKWKSPPGLKKGESNVN